MSGINKVILVGNVGRDPEMRYLDNGMPVTNFSMATARRWRSKTGDPQQEVEWHYIVCWGKLAETAAQYISKGKQVYIEGRIKTRKWQSGGQERMGIEIVARDMQLLGSIPQEKSSKQAGTQSEKMEESPSNEEELPF